MAKITPENLKGMKREDLQKKLVTLQENLRVLRFKHEGSRSKNVKEVNTLRKQVARVFTEINHK